MADTFELEVATPERLLVKEQVTEAQVPGREGYLGILPGHAALLSALKPGVLTYGGGSGGGQALIIDGGFVEVFDNHVRVLADNAEYARDVQTASAKRDLDGANEALRNAGNTGETAAALEAAERAQARLDAAHRGGGE